MNNAERVRIVFRMRLTCTGRGIHRERTVARLQWWDTGARQVGYGIIDHPDREPADPVVSDWGRVLMGSVIPPRSNAKEASGVSRRSYRFRCSSCATGGINVDAARLWLVLEAARRADAGKFDVSALG